MDRAQRFGRTSVVAGWIVAGAGAVVLLGWALDVAALKSVLPGLVTMKVNTALAFAFSGSALGLHRRAAGRDRAGRAVAGLGVLAGLVGVLTLVEYLLGRSLGIDQFLIREPPGAVRTSHLGRMAPGTALCFVLAGASLVSLGRAGHRRPLLGQAAAAAVVLIGLLSVVGYLYGVPFLYGIPAYTAMALHTCAAFVVLGAGLLLARPDRGVAALAGAETAGGTLIRRLVVPAIILPILLGGVALAGERAALYGTEFGTSLLVLAMVAGLGVLGLATATSLHRADLEQAGVRRALADRSAALEAANRELESFSSAVSHDLRAPLRAIDGFSQILAAGHAARLDAEGRRLLGIVQESARRMGSLIDDLLALSRLGREPLEVAGVDMEGIARSVLEEIRAAEPGRAMEIRIGSLPPARGDPSLLRQVWANLLWNAFKYTRPQPRAEIEAGGRAEGAEIVYSVRDNGVGFDMRYAGKLFGVFQRLHRSEEFEGTGMGLAIVKRIVARHGGRVWAEGKVGEGAAFFFALPRAGPGDRAPTGPAGG